MPRLTRLTAHRGRGFTLIEILVVVVIVAISATLVVLSIGVLGRDTELDEETRRLEGLINAVREQAEMQNRDFGLRLLEREYDFLRYDPRRNEWAAVPDDPYFRTRELPPGLRMRLWVEAREALLKPPSDPKKPRPPQVMILSSGDLTEFELHIARENSDHLSTLTGHADGRLEVKNVDEEPRR